MIRTLVMRADEPRVGVGIPFMMYERRAYAGALLAHTGA